MNGVPGSPFCLIWWVTATSGYHATPRTTVSTRSTLQYPDAADRDRRDEVVERNHRYAVERLVACAAIAKKNCELVSTASAACLTSRGYLGLFGHVGIGIQAQGLTWVLGVLAAHCAMRISGSRGGPGGAGGGPGGGGFKTCVLVCGCDARGQLRRD
jgi:hypothetical protein